MTLKKNVVFGILMISILTVFGFCHLAIVSADSPDNMGTYSGTFFNANAYAGGTLNGTLSFQPSSITGPLNFTQLENDSRALCAAGSLSAVPQNNNFVGSFISDDPDFGCGFDRNAIVTITGTMKTDRTHIWGDYGLKNANGSSVSEGTGPQVFDIYRENNLPETVTYKGRYQNTHEGHDGNVTVSIAFGEKTVFGYIDYENDANEPVICGEGPFTGIRLSNNRIYFTFVSDGPLFNCDNFRRGKRGYHIATVTDNKITGVFGEAERALFSGNFRFTEFGDFDVEKVELVFLPIIIK